MKIVILIALIIGFITSATGQVNNPALLKLQEQFEKGKVDFPKKSTLCFILLFPCCNTQYFRQAQN